MSARAIRPSRKASRKLENQAATKHMKLKRHSTICLLADVMHICMKSTRERGVAADELKLLEALGIKRGLPPTLPRRASGDLARRRPLLRDNKPARPTMSRGRTP
eukprot:1184770-Pyramimonas_sp.AAC.1